VSPIVSVIESNTRPRPGARAGFEPADDLAVSCKVASWGERRVRFYT
jgi:hypothetical protein